MGKLYRDPDNSQSFIVTSDPEPRLERPPLPDEGEILKVEFGYQQGVGGRNSYIRCPACRSSICWIDEHVFVFAYLYGEGDGIGNFVRTHLCNRECWAEWAGDRRG